MSRFFHEIDVGAQSICEDGGDEVGCIRFILTEVVVAEDDIDGCDARDDIDQLVEHGDAERVQSGFMMEDIPRDDANSRLSNNCWVRLDGVGILVKDVDVFVVSGELFSLSDSDVYVGEMEDVGDLLRYR
jgi:hypothetical protein